jgi:simple sugar transport system permease protein
MTEAAPARDAGRPAASARLVEGLKRAVSQPEAGPFGLLVMALIVFSLLSATYLTAGNFSNLLMFTPELGMIALGMTLLMTAGEFDLSVGSVFGFSAVLMWTFINEAGMPLELAFLVAMGAAVVIGLFNGLMVTRLGIPSFLVTLGTLLVVRGMALYLTQGFPQRTWRVESPLKEILVGDITLPTPIGDLRIFASVFWFILFAVILGYILMRSRVGNWIQASGGNAMAATARGVRVARTKVALFVLTAFLAAWAGITSSIRVSAANPNSGDGYELEVIAMTVIGGTVLAGGKGTIIGTVIGVLLLRVINNGIIQVGVPGLAYRIFIGGIILGMMALHSYMRRQQQAAA